jgi:phage gp36-like protein
VTGTEANLSYCSLSDLRARYDSRTLAQLSNDSNSTTASDNNQQVALNDAAAEIRTACLQGQIYTSDQLDALVASGDVQLVRMCCDIAVKFLASRRMDALTPSIQARIQASENMLEALRQGKRVLNIANNRHGETPALVTITSLQQTNTGDITANEFFGGAPGTLTVDGSSG